MQVFVTPRAERNFDSIVDYIKDKWGEKTAKEFILKTDETFKLLNIFLPWVKLKVGISEDFNLPTKQEYCIGFVIARLSFWHSLM